MSRAAENSGPSARPCPTRHAQPPRQSAFAGREPRAGLTRGFHQPFQPVRSGLHIAIDDGQPLGRALLNSAVDGAAETGVRSHADDAGAQTLSCFRRAVARAVIHDQNLGRLVGLRAQAAEQLLDHGTAIPNRDDDGDVIRHCMHGPRTTLL
jgi:hypothetical protein